MEEYICKREEESSPSDKNPLQGEYSDAFLFQSHLQTLCLFAMGSQRKQVILHITTAVRCHFFTDANSFH